MDDQRTALDEVTVDETLFFFLAPALYILAVSPFVCLDVLKSGRPYRGPRRASYQMCFDELFSPYGLPPAVLVQFVLTRFYQNVGEFAHQRYKAGRSFHVAFFVEPLAELQQFIVDPQQLLGYRR